VAPGSVVGDGSAHDAGDEGVRDGVRGAGAEQVRAQRTVRPVRSRAGPNGGDTLYMTRESAVPTPHPTHGGVDAVVAVPAVLLALSLLLLL